MKEINEEQTTSELSMLENQIEELKKEIGISINRTEDIITNHLMIRPCGVENKFEEIAGEGRIKNTRQEIYELIEKTKENNSSLNEIVNYVYKNIRIEEIKKTK